MEKQLKQSQQYFEQYMKAECDRGLLAYTDGSAARDGAFVFPCRIDKMSERIRELTEE